MKHIRRWLCVWLAAVMLLTMSACRFFDGDGDASSETTQTTEAPQPVNMITGIRDMGTSELSRPVGVMIANNDFIQDEQVGIAEADMWVEAETEGGITRIMAVYANSERVPDAVGPVRSARSPFFHVVEALGLAYAHAGGSTPALNLIANSNIADLDLNTAEGVAYSWRDDSYPHDYEYRLRTSDTLLTQYMTDKGYKTYAVNEFPWTFGEQSGTVVDSLRVKMSFAQTIGFEYNSQDGLYHKTNGSSATPHTDINGTAIAAKSVLLLYTDKYMENDLTIDFYLQSGTGYVFSDGYMRRFHWSRDVNGFTMTEEDGTKLTLAEGKVYMCMAATEYEGDLSYVVPETAAAE